MAIFLAATGPALVLLAQHAEWRAERKQVSLTPKIDTDPLLSSEATRSSDRTKSDGASVRNSGAHSKRIGGRRWRGQPPIT